MVKDTEAQAKIEIDQQKQIKISYFYKEWQTTPLGVTDHPVGEGNCINLK